MKLTPAAFDETKPVKRMGFFWANRTMDPDAIHRYSFAGFYTDKAFDKPTTHDGGPKNAKLMLEQMWGVTGALDAHRTVQELISGAGYHEMDALLPVAARLADLPAEAFEHEMMAAEQFFEDFSVANSAHPGRLVTRFRHLMRVLRSDSFKAAHAPAIPSTTRAWDLLRVEKVGGTATRLGWIEESEYDRYLEVVLDILQHTFVSFADMAASFWWGRLIWSCDAEVDVAKEMKPYSQELAGYVNHKDSPWVLYPLQMQAAG